MKTKVFFLGCMMTLFACSPQQEKVSTIDPALQAAVDSILQNKMKEVNATSGQAIVMEVQTGEIKAMAGTGKYQESCLTRTVSLLAALESGKVKLSDSVNVGHGVYMVDDKFLRDHNWRRGGYGAMDAWESFMYCSNIGNYLLTKSAFQDDQAYFDMLNKFNYGEPSNIAGFDSLKPALLSTPKDSSWTQSDLAWSCNGYNQRISPIQMLTFYNAIANDGKMVKPMLYKGETEVINPQIASKANIDTLQMAIVKMVNNGLGRPARTEKCQVAGVGGGCQLPKETGIPDEEINPEFVIEFCGYFPADNPQYSIIVSMNKMGMPSSVPVPGWVFRDIVNYMVDAENK
jgi:cell division protein FtsI (penicillin-binding protein 3)